MAVKLRVLEILAEQGRTKYWLNKRMMMHYVAFNKMVNNETDSIRFDTLDRMSKLLGVPAADLLIQTEDEPEARVPQTEDPPSQHR